MTLTFGHLFLCVVIIAVLINFLVETPKNKIKRKSPFSAGVHVTPLFGFWFKHEDAEGTKEGIFIENAVDQTEKHKTTVTEINLITELTGPSHKLI